MPVLCAFDSHDFVGNGLYAEITAMCRKCGAVWTPPTPKQHFPRIMPATVLYEGFPRAASDTDEPTMGEQETPRVV